MLPLAAAKLTTSGCSNKNQANQNRRPPKPVRPSERSAMIFFANRAATVASSLSVLCHLERVINVDTQVPNCTFQPMDFST